MADTQTTNLNLTLPEVGVSTTWANSINANFNALDNAVTLTDTQTVSGKSFTNCTATTQQNGDNSTKIATTAFVQNAFVFSTSLDQLGDVTITNVGNNEFLAYDLQNAKFVNKTVSEAGIQPLIGSNDLSIGFVSGLQTALDGKQATIADGDLTIAKTSGLQSALDNKQPTIGSGSINISAVSGLQTALDGKQATVADGDLQISYVSGLQTALDGKQTLIDSSNRLNATLVGNGNVSNTQLSHLQNVSSDVQSQINNKQASITTNSRLDAGLISSGNVSNSVFDYLGGVTSAIQTQLDSKHNTIDSSNRLGADLIANGVVSDTEYSYLNGLTSNIQSQLDSMTGSTVQMDDVVALSIALG